MSDSDDEPPTGKRYNHNFLERKRRQNLRDSFNELKAELPAFRNSRRNPSRMQVLRETANFITSSRRGPPDSAEINRVQTMQAEMQRMIDAITAATASGGDLDSAAPFVDFYLAQRAEATPSSPENDDEEDDDEEDDEEDEEESTESDNSDGSGESNCDHQAL